MFMVWKGEVMIELQELFIAICEALGIDKLVKWLTKVLAKGADDVSVGN